MRSPEGRYSAVFNGEIFNHRSLRKELEARGARFRGHSDTEVMLATFDAFGVAAAIPRFVGMFAIAGWDTERREAHPVGGRRAGGAPSGAGPARDQAALPCVAPGAPALRLGASRHPRRAPGLPRSGPGRRGPIPPVSRRAGAPIHSPIGAQTPPRPPPRDPGQIA